MTDWTADSRVKIERAKEHILQLEAALETFFQGNPYKAVGEQEPDTDVVVFRAKVRADPPPRMGAIVGDVVHNLRSALDVLVSRLYETATKYDAPSYLSFPIYDTRKQFEARQLREIERASKDAVKLIGALKPYKGGNDALWILQQLNNRDKHHVLTPVASGLGEIKMDFTSALIAPMVKMFPPHISQELEKIAPPEPRAYVPYGGKQRFCPLKHNAELLRLPTSMALKLYEHTHFTFEIAFAEGELVHAQPVMPLLQQLMRMVEGIVDAFVMLPVVRPRGR